LRAHSGELSQNKNEGNAVSFYYINPKPLESGAYEVHQEGCGLLVQDPDRIDLGSPLTPDTALKSAARYYDEVVACVHCGKDA
jgi:hypothetical protein